MFDKATTAMVLFTAGAMLVLGGCAAEPTATPDAPDGDYPDLTLAESKSPVQLSRNEAGGRIPVYAVESIDETGDTSLPCLGTDEDPDELVRHWQSTFVATIVSGNAWRVDAIASNLAESFTDEGWEASDEGEGAISVTNSGATVDVLIEPQPVSDTEASIRVVATGVCVITAGRDSDEVKTLEAEAQN